MQPGVVIDADVRHLGGPDVFHPDGCTAECYPLFHESINIEVFDPQGQLVFLEAPCTSPYYCSFYRSPLRTGETLRRQVELGDHTWERVENVGLCGVCAEAPLVPGMYRAVATFDFALEPQYGESHFIETSMEFALD